MAATQVAANPLDLYTHMSRILNNYLGQACNHIEKTKTLDPNGLVISDFFDEKTIYGAISPVSKDAVLESPGVYHFGDLIAYFLAEDDVMVGENFGQNESRYDIIEYEDTMYTVSKKLKTAYDAGEAVVCKYVLRKIADE